MTRFRQFYLAFPILAQVVQVSWGNILRLLPMKDINRRNYYLNLCIKNNLSRSELLKEIKSNSYERLINKSEKIEIVGPVNKFDILSNMKNPIILEISKKEQIKNEKDLELIILSKLRLFFRQLGEGFTFMDNQYKIAHENKNYFIDILLFNYKLNCFVVVELKLRELKKEDKAQIEFYMNLIDDTLKEPIHNKTIGIIISQKQNKLIANFIRNTYIIPLTYEVQTK